MRNETLQNKEQREPQALVQDVAAETHGRCMRLLNGTITLASDATTNIARTGTYIAGRAVRVFNEMGKGYRDGRNGAAL